jgi:hypothetical protein
MPIAFHGKISMKRKKIIHEARFKRLNVFPLSFAAQEFPPCFKQIFKRNNIVIRMNQLNFSHTPHNTPPETFASAREVERGIHIVVWALHNVAKGASVLFGQKS